MEHAAERSPVEILTDKLLTALCLNDSDARQSIQMVLTEHFTTPMGNPLDDAKLVQSEEELNDEADYFWRTIRQSQTALRTIYKDMKRDADRLSSVLRENERLRNEGRIAGLEEADKMAREMLSDYCIDYWDALGDRICELRRAALEPIKPDEKG